MTIEGTGQLGLIALLDDADSVDDRLRPEGVEDRKDALRLAHVHAADHLALERVCGAGRAAHGRPDLVARAQLPAQLPAEHPVAAEDQDAHAASRTASPISSSVRVTSRSRSKLASKNARPRRPNPRRASSPAAWRRRMPAARASASSRGR